MSIKNLNIGDTFEREGKTYVITNKTINENGLIMISYKEVE